MVRPARTETPKSAIQGNSWFERAIGPSAAVVAPASVATSLPVSSCPNPERPTGPPEQHPGVYIEISFQRRIRRASEERRSQRAQTGTARGRPGTRIIREPPSLQKTHGGEERAWVDALTRERRAPCPLLPALPLARAARSTGGSRDLAGLGASSTSIHSTSTTSEGLRELCEGIDEGGLSWGGLMGCSLFLLTHRHFFLKRMRAARPRPPMRSTFESMEPAAPTVPARTPAGRLEVGPVYTGGY